MVLVFAALLGARHERGPDSLRPVATARGVFILHRLQPMHPLSSSRWPPTTSWPTPSVAEPWDVEPRAAGRQLRCFLDGRPLPRRLRNFSSPDVGPGHSGHVSSRSQQPGDRLSIPGRVRRTRTPEGRAPPSTRDRARRLHTGGPDRLRATKHNKDNLENNHDGSDDNRSLDHGLPRHAGLGRHPPGRLPLRDLANMPIAPAGCSQPASITTCVRLLGRRCSRAATSSGAPERQQQRLPAKTAPISWVDWDLAGSAGADRHRLLADRSA